MGDFRFARVRKMVLSQVFILSFRQRRNHISYSFFTHFLGLHIFGCYEFEGYDSDSRYVIPPLSE
jgi:hypothetical protein